MSPHTHRSVIVTKRPSAKTELPPADTEAVGYVVAMDDREEEEELFSLLILREDRRWGIPGGVARKHGKGEAA